MPPWLSWLTGAIVVVGFLGSVTIYLRGSKDAGTIKTLERSNKALNERVAILEAGEPDCPRGWRCSNTRTPSSTPNGPPPRCSPTCTTCSERHVEELRHHDTETRPLLMAIAAQLQELTDGRH
jgi:hypothetical protein